MIVTSEALINSLLPAYYRHRQLRSQYDRRCRSTETVQNEVRPLPCEERQPPPRCSDQKECTVPGSHRSHDSGCSSTSGDDDRSSVVHVVGPSHRGDCSSCLESRLFYAPFLGGPGLAGAGVSTFWILLELMVMEVVVFFTGRVPFLSPSQQCQST